MTEQIKVTNGKIAKIEWNRERGLTHLIRLDMKYYSQGFGGYRLDRGTAYLWISRLMDILELSTMSDDDAIGKIVRVETSNGGMGHITAIGHPVNDIWLRPSELFAEYQQEG